MHRVVRGICVLFWYRHSSDTSSAGTKVNADKFYQHIERHLVKNITATGLELLALNVVYKMLRELPLHKGIIS